MALLNTLFDKPLSDDLTKSLGNILVSGVENDGNRMLYFNMLSTLIKEKKNLVLVNGDLTGEQHNSLLRLIRPHMIGRKLFDINCGSSADAFDVFSAFENPEDKAEFIVLMLSLISDMPEIIKNKAQRFYLYAISTMEELGRVYKLKDIAMMDVDYVIDLVDSSSVSELEKNRRLRFLTDASMYSSYLDIETCMVKLESYKICELLSGDLHISDVFDGGNVIMLNSFLTDDFKKKELLFNVCFYAFEKYMEKHCSTSDISFLLKDADFISGDYIKIALNYNLSYHYASYIFVDDVTKYIMKNGNDLLDMIKAVVVFTQGSDENANFWSAYFGSRDVQEKSFSYTKKKSWNPFSNIWDSGGVVSSPRKYNTATQSFQKVNKPIYRPEVFRELRPNEAMCYLREPLYRKKARIEG